MWRLRATTEDGLQREMPFLSLDEPFSIATAYQLSVQLSDRLAGFRWPAHLLERELSPGVDGGVPGRSSIGSWNRLISETPFQFVDAERPAVARFQAIRDAVALRRIDEPPTNPFRFIARHDTTTLVFPIQEDVTSITLEYQTTPFEAFRWRELSSLAHGIELSWVESRLYVGAHSATLIGLHPLHTRTPIPTGPIPTGWERAKIETGRVAGMGVATVLRTLGDWAKEINTDPMFQTRLTYAENLHGLRGWPLLEGASLPTSGRMWVLVHGTLSSCYQAFADLPPTQFGDDPVFRFEHDTCAELADNEERLRDLLVNVPADVEIRLLAHSRGGLVARGAGKRLTDTGALRDKRLKGPLNVRVLTFGTPHGGTPIVDQVSGVLDLDLLNGLFGWVTSLIPGSALPRLFGWFAPVGAQQVLSLLARLGAGDRPGGAKFDATLVATAYSLLRAGRLPKGIDEMRDRSSYLRLLRDAMPAWDGCAAWAGTFDIDSDPDGFGIAFEQELSKGMFNKKENDLVIPTESALAFGDKPTIVRGCSHTRYFARPDVQNALKNL